MHEEMTNLLEYRQITNYYVNSDRVQLGHFVVSLTDIHSEHPLGTDASFVMKYKISSNAFRKSICLPLQ